MDLLTTFSWSQVVIGLVALGAGHLYLKRRKQIAYWDKRGIPTSARDGIPYISGFAKIFTTPIHVMFEELIKKHGKIVGLWDRNKPLLFLTDPELMKQVLVKDFHIFTNHQDVSDFPVDEVSKKFMTSLRDNDWKRVRTIMSPTFTTSKMRRMLGCMNAVADEGIEALEEIADKGKEFDTKDFAGKYTMDVIARCLFAMSPHSHKNPENSFLKAAKNIFTLFLLLPSWLVKKFNIKIFPTDSIDYFKSAVTHLIKERKEKNIKADDFLQLLIESQEEHDKQVEAESVIESNYATESPDDSKQINELLGSIKNYKALDELEVIANAVLFLAAGYETTSTLIQTVLYSLACNEKIQERLFEEIESLGDLDYDKVMIKAKYLDCVVMEALRLYPVAGSIEREASQDFTLPGYNAQFEKGTRIVMPVYAIHIDPNNYPDPKKFNPDRFAEENKDNLKPYTYLPFGGGPRNCIGMRFALLEAKLLLARLVLSFKFIQTDKTMVPPKFKKLSGLLAFEPLLVGVEKRKL